VEICGEFRLLVTTRRNIRVRCYNLPPRLQASGWLALDRRDRRLALSLPGLLGEARTEEILTHSVHLDRLIRGGDSQKKPVHRVERPVGVITGE
jgi:hypothetical protein